MPTSAASGSPRGSAASSRELAVLGGVLVVGAMAALLDTTIVSIAIDDLSTVFSASVAATQWVTTAYLLAMGVVIPLMGWMADRWGTRRLWLTSLTLFLLGSVLCATAWSLGSLVVARVVQGLGGGLLLPLVQTILTRAAGPGRVGRVMGAVGIPGQLAPILGPVIGGAVLAEWGWRWLFLINVPICVLALALAWRYLPADTPQRSTRADLLGVALLVPSCCIVLWGLASFETVAPRDFTPGAAIAVGAGLLAAFVAHARRLGDSALVDVRLLAVRPFAVGVIMMFMFAACLYGPMILLPLFFQQVRGLPVADVGLMLAPQGVGTAAALWFAGRAADRMGPRPVAFMAVIGIVASLATFAAVGNEAPLVVLAGALVVLGAGVGTMGVAATTAVYRPLEPAAIPRATSLINVLQRLGAGFGTVAITAVLAHQHDPELPTPTDQAESFQATFWWAAVFTVLALVVARFLPTGAAPERPNTSAVPKPPARSADTPDPETERSTDASSRRRPPRRPRSTQTD